MNTDGKSRQFVVAGTKGSWSPDGSRIAYIEKQDNGPKTIWIYNLLEGQNKVLLKENSTAILSSPAWSPDGKQICFTGRRQRNGDEELCIVDTEGDIMSVTKVKGALTQNSPRLGARKSNPVRNDPLGPILPATPLARPEPF